jgi:Zn-finger nucleic acid-binding protein
MRHCPACGALLQREKEPDAVTELTCPRCSGALEPLRIGATPVLECARCDGLWLDNPTFRGLRDALDRQAAVLASGVAPRYRLGGGASVLPVRYLRCPVCDALMDRVNFAHRSGVLIDVCREHGTWFDEGELHRVVEFISEGGMSGPGWSHAFVHFTR